VVFVAKYVSAMVFGGGILGGTHKIWGNPYLNSTTVLFDISLLYLELLIVVIYMYFVVRGKPMVHAANLRKYNNSLIIDQKNCCCNMIIIM